MKKTTLLCSIAAACFLTTAARAANPAADWTASCAACHGHDGAGHTRAGRMLGAKDLTNADYQKSFTNDQAFRAIKDGFKDAAGRAKMKPAADKLSDEQIKALVAYVRSLRK